MKAGGRIDLGRCGLALQWSVQARAKHDGQPSGDGYTILRREGCLVFAVADGSGSGHQAARAVNRCLTSLEAASDPFEVEFLKCHERLRGGRGAALAALSVEVDSGTMTWAAVGDVDGILMRGGPGKRVRHAAVMQIAGTLGIRFDRIVPQSHALQPGDMLVMTTDGVSRNHRVGTAPDQSAEEVATHTLQTYGSPHDDCLVMAIEVVAIEVVAA